MCFLKNITGCEVEINKPLKEFCTFKIGGKAKYLVIVKNTEALIKVCVACDLHNIKYKVIGFGSNLLFADEGFSGAIIVNKASRVFKRKNCIYADSGTPFFQLINFAFSHSLGGIEKLAGIPATVGGAVVNNMGAFGVSMSDVVDYVEGYSTKNLNKKVRISARDALFDYRDSIFKKGSFIITRVKIKLQFMDKSEIFQNLKSALEKKNLSQPLNYPSAGSVFKRSDLIPAKVIDDLHLKGLKIGGAQVSEKHAGFIININDASARDVLSLINLINDKVQEQYGKTLTLEIEYVN